MPRLAVLTLALLALLAPAALAQDGEPLTPGQRVTGRLPDEGRPFKTWTVTVPRGATKLRIRLRSDQDVDVYLKAGGPIVEDWQTEATAKANGPGGDEELVLTPDGTPALSACTWYVDVVQGDPQGEGLKYTLELELVTGDPASGAQPLPVEVEAPDLPRITGDQELEVDLPASAPNYRTWVLEVAPDVAEVAIEVTADKDVDFYLRHGAPMSEWSEAHHKADSPEGHEVLVLRRDGPPRLRSGVYFLDVARAVEDGAHARLQVRFTRGYQGAEPAGAPLEPSNEEGVSGEVRADTLFELDLDRGENYRTYGITVPEGARSLLVTVRGARQDVDLYLRHGAQIEDYRRDPDHSANGARSDEQLFVDGESSPPLRPGRYYLDVVRAGRPPLGKVEVAVRFDAERPSPLPAADGEVLPLPLGQRTEVDLGQSGSKAARFTVEVPEGARSLHVVVLHAKRDVDLFLRHGSPITDYQERSGFDHKAVSACQNERLTVDLQSDPPLRPGTYYVDAANLLSGDARVTFTVVASVDEPPALGPDDLRLPPFARPQPLNELEQVIQATVQISSDNGEGSGTCVSPGGLILTNYHVLENEGKLQRQGVYISFVDDFDRAPEQVFLAEVVEADEELDLVLLRVASDVFRRPLPEGLRLPFLPLGDSSKLRIGEPLLVAGYPSVGGLDGQMSISTTRGVVSGFISEEGGRTWIKTDARINAGNSGGTALNARYELVGIPSREQIEADDELGYCRPTNIVPAPWRERIAADGK